MTTGSAEANRRFIESAYSAFARGDLAAVFQVLDERIFWHVPGRGPLSGDYRGHEEVLGFFGQFMRSLRRDLSDPHRGHPRQRPPGPRAGDRERRAHRA